MPRFFKLSDGRLAVEATGRLAAFANDPGEITVLPLAQGETVMTSVGDGTPEADPQEVATLALTQEHVDKVCRAGKGCRYLALDPEKGFTCLRGEGNYDLINTVNDRVREGTFRSTEDGCGGRVGGVK